MEKAIDILLNLYFFMLGTLGLYCLWRGVETASRRRKAKNTREN